MKAIISYILIFLMSCIKYEIPQPSSISPLIYNITVTEQELLLQSIHRGAGKWQGFHFTHPFTLPLPPIPFAIIYTFPINGTMANVAISFYGGADADFNTNNIYIRQTDSVAVDCSPPFIIEKIYCQCDSIYYNGNQAMIFFDGVGSIDGIFLRNNLQ
jgi:hypothetical protein